MQSDINAVLAVDGGWEELTHDTDPKSLVSEIKSWISDSLNRRKPWTSFGWRAAVRVALPCVRGR
jgi:hypothetical protein